MSGIAERLAEVLAEHREDYAYPDSCTCEDAIPNTRGGHFVAHVAQALLPVVEREIAAARGEVVARVLSLHFRRPWRSFPGGDMVTFGQTEFPDQCNHCRVAWPCLTSAALSPDPDRGEGEVGGL